MAGHTEGPWTIPTPSMGFSEIRGGGDELIFGLAAGGADEKQDDDTCEANGRRIVACVNACAGIPIEELEKIGANGFPVVRLDLLSDAAADAAHAIAKAEGQP